MVTMGADCNPGSSVKRCRGTGGWVHGVFAVLAVMGVWVSAGEDITVPQERPHYSECDGVPYTPDERGSVDRLVTAGWHATGSRLYPPQCR
jgi:hypothetical protein